MSSATQIFLPPTLPYPIKITSIDASGDIQRGTRLLSYSFVYVPRDSHNDDDPQPETRFGTWDSSVEGAIERWNVHTSDVLSKKKAGEKPAVFILEPCKHGMQLGGLCVLCGKDMTNADYTGFSDASRASIQMTHSAFGPTVSLEEAQRIERETAGQLLKAKRLSLIVDLDQTIVHATVDPTVGEWISEGEAWEASHTANNAGEDEEQCNPNWEALKDVKKFKLAPEIMGIPQRGLKGKTKATMAIDGCMYYIKPRPGWDTFLPEMASKYEMHVYTMGTRAYAEAVCDAIDPDKKIFGGRILSRDESGSLTTKSLQRLFPCDTSMVVIIDDRADVWEWSPNLIKVIPYDFFIGIGDINSSFLPKIQPLAQSTTTQEASATPSISSYVPSSPGDSNSPDSAERSFEEASQRSTKELLNENSRALEAQVEERPLAKRQEELRENKPSSEPSSRTPSEDGKVTPAPQIDQGQESDAQVEKDQQSPLNGEERMEVVEETEKHARKALLKNDDIELDRVKDLLNEVHRRFYAAYESRSSSPTQQKRHTLSGKKKDSHKAVVPYDVTQIIPAIRLDVLKGVHILFSSVIPLDTRPQATEIWRIAHMFGAYCSTELSGAITHVVAAKPGTVKVDAARKRGGIKIVWLAWFTDSIALWRRLDEGPYLMANPANEHGQVKPDHAAADDDEDEEDGEEWDSSGSNGAGPAGAAPGGGGSKLELSDIDWNDIDNEVDAAMAESDDDDDDDMDDGNTDGMSDVSVASNTPQGKKSLPVKRKRARSVTPSSKAGSESGEDTGSPLSKRKKLASDRAGASKLKAGSLVESISMNGSRPQSPAADDDDEESSLGDDPEDDFLADALEEELG